MRVDVTGSYLLDSFLMGLKKTGGGNPKRKRPITPKMLMAFAQVTAVRGGAEDFIILLAICIGFFCFLRKSNLTVESETLLDTTKLLRRSDVRIDHAQYAIWVRIRRTKTIQSGDRELWIPIHGQRGHPLDVVHLFSKVLAFYAHLPADTHLLRSICRPLGVGRDDKSTDLSTLPAQS